MALARLHAALGLRPVQTNVEDLLHKVAMTAAVAAIQDAQDGAIALRHADMEQGPELAIMYVAALFQKIQDAPQVITVFQAKHALVAAIFHNLATEDNVTGTQTAAAHGRIAGEPRMLAIAKAANAATTSAKVAIGPISAIPRIHNAGQAMVMPSAVSPKNDKRTK